MAELTPPDTRQILISGIIDDDLANKVCAEVLLLRSEDPKAPIYLFIDSPGGSFGGLAIADAVSISGPVHTFGLSEVSGIALLILALGQRGKRHCMTESKLSLPAITGSDGDDEAQLNVSIARNMFAQRLTNETNLNGRDAAVALREGRTFTLAEAIQFGIVDAVYPPTSNASESGHGKTLGK